MKLLTTTGKMRVVLLDKMNISGIKQFANSMILILLVVALRVLLRNLAQPNQVLARLNQALARLNLALARLNLALAQAKNLLLVPAHPAKARNNM